MSKAKMFVYAACGTCKKAQKWLDAHEIPYDTIPIVEQPPGAGELADLIARSGLPPRKWFNTSGQSYRALVAELGKERVASLSDAEIIERLAADGKLIKRPVLVTDSRVLVGFQEGAYAELTT